mmetsp:Transcript_23147/g.87610  ORF Transcript_23147/g.87610 Transcript_23147/m.87610 type:complete len:238 (-) Transcript_23147:823-1536(-)
MQPDRGLGRGPRERRRRRRRRPSDRLCGQRGRAPGSAPQQSRGRGARLAAPAGGPALPVDPHHFPRAYGRHGLWNGLLLPPGDLPGQGPAPVAPPVRHAGGARAAHAGPLGRHASGARPPRRHRHQVGYHLRRGGLPHPGGARRGGLRRGHALGLRRRGHRCQRQGRGGRGSRRRGERTCRGGCRRLAAQGRCRRGGRVGRPGRGVARGWRCRRGPRCLPRRPRVRPVGGGVWLCPR